MTIGSTVSCGFAPCPLFPFTLIRNVVGLAITGPYPAVLNPTDQAELIRQAAKDLGYTPLDNLYPSMGVTSVYNF